MVHGFKLQLGYVRRVFQLSLYSITFGGQLAYLAHLVHKVAVKQQLLFYTKILILNKPKLVKKNTNVKIYLDK